MRPDPGDIRGPRRFLVLNHEYPPLGGGASPVTRAIARELVERGDVVDVITMGRKGLPPFEVVIQDDAKRIYRRDRRVERLLASVREIVGVQNLGLARRMDGLKP